MRRAALLAAVAVGLLVLPAPAGAGGSWMAPALDRYEVGEVATVVGYTGGGQLGWIEDGPYEAVLDPGGHRLGVAVLQETGRGGWLSLRVSVSFVVPELVPGGYDVLLENAEGEGLGDIISGPLFVGVDPAYAISRDWPADDPARAGATTTYPLVTTPTASDDPAGSAPGWVLVACGVAALALGLAAGLRPRRGAGP